MGILNKIKKGAKETKGDEVSAKKSTAKKEAKVEKQEEKKATTKKAESASIFAYGIIREPVTTEKGDHGQMKGQYTFIVMPGAGKVEIARAIKELYGVKPLSVRTINVQGKVVRHGRSTGKRKNRKKAIVTLKPGDTISVTE